MSGADSLSAETISRFSRQLLLPGFELEGQKSLSAASAVIVGAGGLGCPAALYLATAGIGRLGIVDYDAVESSNLHRQILHTESRVGMSKAASAALQLSALYSACRYEPIETVLDASNALRILAPYDVILDTSDNMATRYLLNDAALLLNKPLVSGSALRWEGQLTVYNGPGGPCYRCLFPVPPDPSLVANCNDGGILGPITGTIGAMQALETIRLILGKPNFVGKMLLFDGSTGEFKTVKLRGRQPDCQGCGASTSILPPLLDYVQFCRSSATDKTPAVSIRCPSDRLTAQQYKALADSKIEHLLIDVREDIQYKICSLPNAMNISYKQMSAATLDGLDTTMLVVCVCRRGNDSQRAAAKLQSEFGFSQVKDIAGGLESWSRLVDPSFPIY